VQALVEYKGSAMSPHTDDLAVVARSDRLPSSSRPSADDSKTNPRHQSLSNFRWLNSST
jgi:hypothetical protein